MLDVLFSSYTAFTSDFCCALEHGELLLSGQSERGTRLVCGHQHVQGSKVRLFVSCRDVGIAIGHDFQMFVKLL